MTHSLKRGAYASWLLLIAAFAIVHALHLRADFPNHSPWTADWAKYTDEGWYGNAAIRAHLFGNWYLAGDFNPAPAVPVWPFLEWIVFSFTGVSIEAARGLAVFFFFLNLALAYLLLRLRGSRWMALLALTLIITSPFVYSFSRLAILEPMLITFLLAALNIAARLGRMRIPVAAAAAVGVLFTLMLLTKTTAVFLLPALVWAIATAQWPHRKALQRSLAAAAAASAVTFVSWMAVVVHAGMLRDYRYLFRVNNYPRPAGFYWPFVSFWWSFHGGLWIDHVLIPVAGLVTVALALCWSRPGVRQLVRDPVYGASILAFAGYVLFMTYQYHPQPRYFAVVAPFSFFVLAMGAEALLHAQPGPVFSTGPGTHQRTHVNWPRLGGTVSIAACCIMAVANGIWTLEYAAHPEYTWTTAAAALTRYIDQHPNGNRLLVSASGDEITLMTHLPSICDEFGTMKLPDKLARYQPGWWATWNDIDPRILEALHVHYSLEQVASFHTLDDPERNVLVLFKLHPLSQDRKLGPTLRQPLPGDKTGIDVE